MSRWELLSFGEKAVKSALSEGVDQAEAFLYKGKLLSISLEKGEVKEAKSIIEKGIGVRVAIGKRIGFSYSTILEEGDVVAKKAVQNARASPSDEDFRSFPEPTEPRKVEGLFDKKIADLEIEDAVELIKDMVEASKVDKRIYSIGGGFFSTAGTVAVLNSLGVERAEELTQTYIYAYISARDGDDMSAGYEFNEGRHLSDIDPRWVGEEAANLAIRSLGAIRIETGEYDVIIDPVAMPSFIGFLVSSAANAENVQYGRSFLAGKLGQKISREEISIFDDGTIPGASASVSFDGEGVSTGRTPVIQNGFLKSYIHNSYTAGKEGSKSTGNASRSYDSLPSIDSHNVILEAKALEAKKDELLDVRKGVLFKQTGDRPNLANGEFSGLMSCAFLIEDGEITKGLKEASFGINLMDFLNKIDLVGDDIRQVGSTITPSCRVIGMRIAGK
ncbi:MAG: hypothetical protein DRO05_02820 [Thermoproteota archaeon]|nr:MAG: hypothetical protein DRO05_02820 [Candidatus Korarchaeota archaeon]